MLIDRVIGLLGVFSFAPLSILVIKGMPSKEKILLLFIFISLFIIILIYLSWTNIFSKFFERTVSYLNFLKLKEKILEFYNHYKMYSLYPKEIFISYILTILLQASFSIQAYFCALALNISLSPFIFIFLIPLINALNFIPITISGLGLREGGFYLFFSKYISSENAVSLSLLYFLTGVIACIPFGIYIFRNSLNGRKK